MWTRFNVPPGLKKMADLLEVEKQVRAVASWSCPCGGVADGRRSSKKSVAILRDMVAAESDGVGNAVALRDEIDALVTQIREAAAWLESELGATASGWRDLYGIGLCSYRRARGALAVMRCYFDDARDTQYLRDGMTLFEQAMADIEDLEQEQAA